MTDLEKALASVVRTIDTLSTAVEARKDPHQHSTNGTQELVNIIGKLTDQAIALGKAIAMTPGEVQLAPLYPDDIGPRP